METDLVTLLTRCAFTLSHPVSSLLLTFSRLFFCSTEPFAIASSLPTCPNEQACQLANGAHCAQLPPAARTFTGTCPVGTCSVVDQVQHSRVGCADSSVEDPIMYLAR